MPETRHILDFAATFSDVRLVLEGLHTGYLGRTVGRDLGNMAELVLAEALNNVVEHAAAVKGGGRVRLALLYDPPTLTVELYDNGTAMPDLSLPEGELPRVDTCIGDLPEGGFGWHLIRTLARDLEYRRIDGWNHLRFWLAGDA